jgi:hypothetical protein
MKKMFAIFMIMLGACIEGLMLELGLIKGFAKIKFGQIISEARGKIAGMVFSRNSSCSYIRQKVTPINPNTSFQSDVRGSLSLAAKAWAALSDAIKASFKSHVGTLGLRNSIGDAYTISGFNYFVQLCRNAFSIGAAAPSTFPGTTVGVTPVLVSGSISHAPELFEITLANAVLAADKCVVYATPPMSLGKSFVKSEYRKIRVLENADGVTVGITGSYTAKFGGIPQAGEHCFIKIMSINSTSFKAGAALAKSVK